LRGRERERENSGATRFLQPLATRSISFFVFSFFSLEAEESKKTLLWIGIVQNRLRYEGMQASEQQQQQQQQQAQ
jgi:hypothetical protein